MKKSAAKTMRDIAERRVAAFIRDHLDPKFERFTEDIVDLVLEVVSKPDVKMVVAGANELILALPPQARAGYRRQLVQTMYIAMMDRVG